MKKGIKLAAFVVLSSLLAFTAVADEGGFKVAIVGDTLAAGAGVNKNRSFANLLKYMLGANFDVQNFSVANTTVLINGKADNGINYAYMKHPSFGRSIEWEPKVVIIMLGSSDAKEINWKEFSSEFEADFRDLISAYLEMNPAPVVMVATPPMIAGEYKTMTDAVLSGQIAPIIRKVAKDMDVVLLDMNVVSRQRRNEYLKANGFELTEKGHLIFAAVFKNEVFKKMGMKTKKKKKKKVRDEDEE